MVGRLSCVFFFLNCLACSAWAQTAILQGKVINIEGDPIPDVTVTLDGTPIATVTDPAGEYRMHIAVADAYTLRASAPSYRTETAKITIAAGQTVTKDLILQSSLRVAEEVVVTGTTTPETPIESSTSISSLSGTDLNDAAPRSTTEFLRRVPGFTRVESSGGEVNQNIAVRGLLGVDSVSIEEDGIMVYPTMSVFFMNADNLIRPDENLEKIEILRSGSSPIFGSSTSGAIVNLLNKTGGSELHGVLKGTSGTSGLGRFDFNLNGPISDDWRFNVGGFYRYDHGVRDPGYTGTSGGQLKANVTRFLSNGFFKLSFKHIDDKNLFILPLPFQNPDDPDFVPGFSETGSFYTKEGVDIKIPLPQSGSLRLPLDDGIKTKGTWVTGQLNFNFGRDWQFENISQVMSVDHTWNALLSKGVLSATDFAQSTLDFYIANELVSPGTTYQLQFTNHFDEAGNKLPFDTQNGLIRSGAQWHIEKPLSDFSDLLTIKKPFGPHSLSFATYFAYYKQSIVWYLPDVLTDVRDNPRFLDLIFIQPDGSTLDVTKNGFLHFLPEYHNGEGSNTLIAFFTSDEFKLSERLRIDLGIRYELQNFFEDVENVESIDLDGDPRTQYDIESFGNQTFKHFEFSLDDIAFSTGINYQINPKHLAIYGSFTRGFIFLPLDFLLFEQEGGVDLFKPIHTDMFEVGVKYSGSLIALTSAFFYGRTHDFIIHQPKRDPTGHIVFDLIPIADNSSWGMEFEVLTQPTKRLELHGSATFVSNEAPEINLAGQFYDGLSPSTVDFDASYFVHKNTRVIFDLHFVGERFSNSDLTARLPAFYYINIGASYKFPDRGITIESRILNLTQSKGLEEGDPFGVSPNAGVFLARPILPRRITLEARYEF